MGRFYLAVIQQILLHGSESWIISPTSQRLLESFHHRCARYMAHRHIRRCTDGSWEHPDTAHVLMCCGLSPIMTYIAQRKTRLLNHYAMPSSALYSQCLASHPFVSSAVHWQVWWTTPVDMSILGRWIGTCGHPYTACKAFYCCTVRTYDSCSAYASGWPPGGLLRRARRTSIFQSPEKND